MLGARMPIMEEQPQKPPWLIVIEQEIAKIKKRLAEVEKAVEVLKRG